MSQSTPRPSLRIVTPPGRRQARPELPRGLAPAHRGSGIGGTADDRFLPAGYVRAVESVDLSASARDLGDAARQTLQPGDGQVLAIELAEGVTVYTSPENLQRTLAQLAPDAAPDDGSLQLEQLETRAAGTRGLRAADGGGGARLVARITTLDVGQAGDAITEAAGQQLRDWLGERLVGKAAEQLGITWWGTKALMWAIEDRHGRTHGLYRWVGGETQPAALFAPENDPRLAKEAAQGPVLVFIHGTASSVGGSFGDLQAGGAETWRALELQYGERIYGFEHRSLSESPIDNALQLARCLPEGARLHLVTHSRGGLVGDLLCLEAHDDAALDALLASYAVDDVALGGVDDADDRARLANELGNAYEGQRAALRELAALLKSRRLRIERYVRVASPARGTRLASGNFDVFLSGLLSLIGLVPGLAGNPWYTAFKRVVLEIAKNRTRPQRVPGIEAMLPGSPMARLLARLPAQDGTQLAVIAGDIEGGGLLKRLGVLFTDHMFFDGVDNDLVVDTDSMSAGVARPATTRRLFDQGPEVNHFRYFTNGSTRQALQQWLSAPEPGALPQFSALPGLAPERSLAETQRRDLARAAQRGLVPSRLPVVIVLPGVMGSHLWVNGRDRVWLDPLDLLVGGLAKLSFGKPGVSAEKLFDMSYGDLCEHLAASHQVERFPYDWRQPLDTLADAFADKLSAVLADSTAAGAAPRPVRVLAHSMGGLVVRALIARHPTLWEQLMQHPDARLVMLGTPNHGSHQMVEMLIGKGDTVRMLAMADQKHKLQQLLDIVGSFRGPLALLPRPGFKDQAALLGGAGQQLDDYFSPTTWDDLRERMVDGWFAPKAVARIAPAALAQASWLWRQDGGNPELPVAHAAKTVYVHGVAASTACGIVYRRERWLMLSTPQGDGTVSWASGRLAGIGQYYYMRAGHGALADTAEYFDDLVALLEQRAPQRLETAPPRTRDATGAELPALTAYDAGPPQMPSAEELTASLLRRTPKAPPPARAQRRLAVRVVNDDLRSLERPILVGHYEQDALAGPEALIDRELVQGALRQRYELGVYAGRPGSATVVLPPPNAMERARGSRRGAVVAGLGPFDGTLGAPELTAAVRHAVTRLLLQVVDNAEPMPAEEATAGLNLAALLVGYASTANLTLGDVLGALLRGTAEANQRFHETTGTAWHVASLDIVELYRDTAISAARELRQVAASLQAQRALRCRIEVQPMCEGGGARERLHDARSSAYWSRLMVGTAESAEAQAGPAPAGAGATSPPADAAGQAAAGMRRGVAGRLRFLYLGSGRARVEALVLQRQPGLVEHLVAQQLANTQVDAALGTTLFQLMVPADLREAVRQLERAVLVLDGSTANLPWELMRVDGQPLACRAALVRQLSTLQYRPQVHQASGRRALVIGNPSYTGFGAAFSVPGGPQWPDPNPLNGAEQEARAVVEVMRQTGWDADARIGQDQDAYAVIQALLGQPWRLLHIAAHGVVDLPHPDSLARSGVLLSGGQLITVAEIGAMQAVPELVFLNCCHLGQVDLADPAPYQQQRNRLAASLARELIEAGARAVVVAGWAVDDNAAERFARVFYTALLGQRLSFGDAVHAARKATYAEYEQGTTWGAYQAYGDPGWRLAGEGDVAPAPAAGSAAVAPLESPRELLAALQQRQRDARRQAAQRTPSVERADAAWARAQLAAQPGWARRADVACAAARLLQDLGPEHFDAAIALYRQALQDPAQSGQVDVQAVQQLANLEARRGEMASLAAGPGDAAARDAALADIDRAIGRLTRLLEMLGQEPAAPTAGAPALDAERACLLGSACKRRAAVHARFGDVAAMRDDLQRSLDWYRAATPADAAPEQQPYPVLNWLALAAFDPGLVRDPALDTAAFTALAERARRAADARFGRSRDFWDAVMAADALWTLALLHGELGDAARAEAAVARLHAAYQDSLAGLSLPMRGLDSVTAQLRLLADCHQARADAGAAGTANPRRDRCSAQALRALAERLQPGSTGAAPAATANTSTTTATAPHPPATPAPAAAPKPAPKPAQKRASTPASQPAPKPAPKPAAKSAPTPARRSARQPAATAAAPAPAAKTPRRRR